jgi:hypothetical protein
VKDDAFLKLANALNESLNRELEYLRRTIELRQERILELELEIARMRGHRQGMEMVARAIDNYPLGERPDLPPRFTASLSRPPGQV